MQDPEVQEIIELQSRVADIKSRLRQLEVHHHVAGGDGEALDAAPAPSALNRAKHHLELALEALGTPKYGFASNQARSLQLTGFYSSDIYKALQDVRSRKRGSEGESTESVASQDDNNQGVDANGNRRSKTGPGRRKSDRMAQRWSGQGGKKSKRKPKKGTKPDHVEEEQPVGSEAAAVDPAQHSPDTGVLVDVSNEQGESGRPSTWVKHRVDEIHRALSAAFGEDDLFSDSDPDPAPVAAKTPSAPEFIGNTDALSIPELIGFFQLQGKTGVLTVDAKKEQFSLEYMNGELIHARSSSSPEGHRLGDVLVKLGHITQSKLDRLMAGKSAAERIGDALRRGDVVSEQALAEALQYQIQNIFHRLFDLKGCRFTFREGLDGEPNARIRYNVTRLLLETARHRDELEGAANRRAS